MLDKQRCGWCGNDMLYQKYHDTEWGRPVYDDRVLFEFLILEGFQAGLSWITILRKRDAFIEVFDNFDYTLIARYDEVKINQLLSDERIIRNRLKIRSAITNAQAFMTIRQEFGSFSDYIWKFLNYRPIINHYEKLSDIPARTDYSDRISRDLKKRGFKFVGSTIIYAFMQAVGMVDDHLESCWIRTEKYDNKKR